jgi:hypothetical protein
MRIFFVQLRIAALTDGRTKYIFHAFARQRAGCLISPPTAPNSATAPTMRRACGSGAAA